MIHNEQKKWFLYSTLPPNINKLFIYMPTVNDPMAEKALEELTNYLKNSLNVIGKVTRVDTDSSEGWLMPVDEGKFPMLLLSNGDRGQWIPHHLTDIIMAVSSYLPEVEIDLNVAERVKALKDGKDLL